jgi:prepilin-type N-terminal cleavage/methylation domain-containing protein
MLRIPGTPSHRQKGYTLAEVMAVTVILGVLVAAGFTTRFQGCDLAVAQLELKGSLDQAFSEARARGRNVSVSMSNDSGTDVLPVRLPRTIRFGKPAHIPLPPGVTEPKVAATTGEAHPRITVTPRRTATAALWFLNDGEEALCMRLNGHGSVLMYRWRSQLNRWVRV